MQDFYEQMDSSTYKNDGYFDYYSIKTGDSIYGISKKYNINPELLTSLNGLNKDDYIYPGQIILIPKSNYSYYITKKGDTLDEALKILNVPLNKMLKENKTIYLLSGQLLVKKKN